MGFESFLAFSGSTQGIATTLGIGASFFLILLIGIIIVTGLALFKAARLNDKVWFWVMLIIGTMGILPLIYLYIKRKKKI